MAGCGGNCRKKGGLVAVQGRAPNRVPAGLQAVAPLREVIFFVQPGAVVKKIPIFAAVETVPIVLKDMLSRRLLRIKVVTIRVLINNAFKLLLVG